MALWAALVLPAGLVWLGALLGWWLLLIAVLDGRHFLLPDSLTLPLLAGGLAAAYGLVPERWLWHLAGAAVGWLLFAALAWLYKRLRGRAGLGGGDARLMAAAGAWVGLEGLASVLLIACFAALLFALLRLKGKARFLTRPVPFGAFLAPGIWLVWLYGAFTWRGPFW